MQLLPSINVRLTTTHRSPVPRASQLSVPRLLRPHVRFRSNVGPVTGLQQYRPIWTDRRERTVSGNRRIMISVRSGGMCQFPAASGGTSVVSAAAEPFSADFAGPCSCSCRLCSNSPSLRLMLRISVIICQLLIKTEKPSVT
jgi:hypothetical protein